MPHLEACYPDFLNLQPFLDLQFKEFEIEAPAGLPRAGKTRLHELREAFLRARWPRYREPACSPTRVLRVEQEKRQPTEVVTMKMREQHQIDFAWRDPLLTHSDQRRCSAIDEESPRVVSYEEAGLVAAPCAKGVAAAQKAELHTHNLTVRDLPGVGSTAWSAGVDAGQCFL